MVFPLPCPENNHGQVSRMRLVEFEVFPTHGISVTYDGKKEGRSHMFHTDYLLRG